MTLWFMQLFLQGIWPWIFFNLTTQYRSKSQQICSRNNTGKFRTVKPKNVQQTEQPVF